MAVRKETSRTSLLWTLLKIALAVVLAAFVLSKTDLGELLALRGRILPGWLALAFLLYLLLTVVKSLQYYILIGRSVSYPQVLHVVIVQNAVSNFIATSAGIASYLTLFRMEHDVKLSRSALAFVLAKVGDLISIWLLLFLSAFAVWNRIAPLHLAVEIILAAIGAALLGFFLLVILRQRFAAVLRRALEWLRLDRIGDRRRAGWIRCRGWPRRISPLCSAAFSQHCFFPCLIWQLPWHGCMQASGHSPWRSA